jgi:cell division septation protein DedD
VSDSHEPSYYEIALTNRQVIVAFVILLVCLIAAFFSGVWVGRENGYRTAEQMARNAPSAEEEKKEGQNLEELEFFESGQKAATPEPAPAPPTPGEDTTLAEDVGSEESASPAPEEDTAPAVPADDEEETQSRRDRRRERAAKKAAEERAAQARTEPDQPAPARTRPEPTKAPVAAEPARKAGQVVIQVFSSPEKDQAERIRGQLVRGGQRAFLSPVEVSGRTMYRVRIGPFDSRGDAQKVAEQVRKGYKLDTWVTE